MQGICLSLQLISVPKIKPHFKAQQLPSAHRLAASPSRRQTLITPLRSPLITQLENGVSTTVNAEIAS